MHDFEVYHVFSCKSERSNTMCFCVLQIALANVGNKTCSKRDTDGLCEAFVVFLEWAECDEEKVSGLYGVVLQEIICSTLIIMLSVNHLVRHLDSVTVTSSVM